MPFWNRQKEKGSQSSSSQNQFEFRYRSPTAARQDTISPRQPSPSPEPFLDEYTSQPLPPQAAHQIYPPPHPAHPDSSDSLPRPSAPLPRSQSSLEPSTLPYPDIPVSRPEGPPRDAESKKGRLREKLGLKAPSPRESPNQSQEDTSSRTVLRRKLSTKIDRLSGSDQTSPNPHQPQPRGTTNDSETGSYRDLADFLKTTAPSTDPRRPASVVGASSRDHFAELPADPTRSRLTSTHPDEILDDTDSDEQYLAELDNQGRRVTRPQQENNHIVDQINRQNYQQHTRSEDFSRNPDFQKPPQGFSRPRSRQEAEPQGDSRAQTPEAVRSQPGYRGRYPIQSPPPPQQLQQPRLQARDKDSGLFLEANLPVGMQSGQPGLQPPQRAPADPSDPPTPGMVAKGHPIPSPGPPRGSVSQAGRRTPPPGRTAADMSEDEVNQILEGYRELREKYSKVKRYYFEKEAQVTQLQNAVAHQRLSQSRTSLDDGEYVNRLTRLDGLIAQLAFQIRKDWRVIPSWLHSSVNKDAMSTGKQEMTAVGRAFISHWICKEAFEKYFHPALSFESSRELKSIQLNLRRYAPALQIGEEEDALTSKITNWRLATMDGLHPAFISPEAGARRQQLVQTLNQELVKSLHDHMSDPPPAGVEGGVSMVIDLVVATLGHLPAESRDVSIEYYMPGTLIHPDFMKAEQGIPPLSNPIASFDLMEGEVASHNGDGDDEERADGSREETEQTKEQTSSKRGFLGGLVKGKKSGNRPPFQQEGATQSSTSLQPPSSSGGPQIDRVRLCILPGVQIRGKTMLAKAPVYAM